MNLNVQSPFPWSTKVVFHILELYQLCYIGVMRAQIVNQLLQQERPEKDVPLPSVRTLAQLFGASPLTVNRALKDLALQEVIYSIARKGYFWGSHPSAPRELVVSFDPGFQMGKDLHSGVFHPFEALPSVKELAQYYQTSGAVVRRILVRQVGQGILERRGQKYFMVSPSVPSQSAVVILVLRCDINGQLLLESEREMDFVRSVYREAHERNLGVDVIGYEDLQSEGLFLDCTGQVRQVPTSGAIVLGVLVSTWLVRDPRLLLRKLGQHKWPLSVWWEHHLNELPAPNHRNAYAYFNLAFGAAPGRIVAELLLARGHRRVAYISPYHLSAWSLQRLEGLKERMAKEAGGFVLALTDLSEASPWSMLQSHGTAARSQRYLLRLLAQLLAHPEFQSCTALVCVNDLVAEVVVKHKLIQAMRSVPYLVSFDNSSASYRYQFDSFAFQTEGMVRQMIYHLGCPHANLFASRKVHEMVGKVVLKRLA